ncbi:hypothetical protein EYF80_014665 [Liparis tanakae]|uniref:Uncharacterized protein n=1 Tax=Liparis tanakae TaxID=230148 RepID=A0A4Z2ICE4_9TELE|nr:hypothetical protein EYF80_014665 [Liparis tanakae]
MDDSALLGKLCDRLEHPVTPQQGQQVVGARLLPQRSSEALPGLVLPGPTTTTCSGKQTFSIAKHELHLLHVLTSGRNVPVSSESFSVLAGSKHHSSKPRRCVEQFCSSRAPMARVAGRGPRRQCSSTSVWISFALPGSLDSVCNRKASRAALEQDSSRVLRPRRCAGERQTPWSRDGSAFDSRGATVDAELGWRSLAAAGDEALLGEEQQLGHHVSEIAGVHVAVQRQEGLERSGLLLCCLGALLRQFLEHGPLYSAHVARYEIQATQSVERGGAGLQQGQNVIVQLSTQVL